MKLFNFDISEALIVAIFSMMVVVSLLLHFKPHVMFTLDGQFKKFGTGNTQTNTLFPFWLVVTTFSIAVYYMYTLFY